MSDDNKQNQHMQTSLRMLNECMQHLMRHGYTVIGVTMKTFSPVIDIQHCRRCNTELLNARSYQHIENTAAGRLYHINTFVKGCRVRWESKDPIY